MQRIVEIQNSIKEFTQKKPSIMENIDTDYKCYLAQCARLLELDIELNMLYNLNLEDINDEINFLKEEVNQIITSR